MNDLQERTQELLTEPWLERDLAAIHARAAKVRSRQRRVAVAGLVALVLVLGVGAVVAARPDRGDAPTTLDAAEAPAPVYERADADRMVFLVPTATVDQQGALRAQLVADPAVGQAWWRSQQDSYDEFTCLFADQPNMIDSVTPSILPTSFDVVLVPGSDADAFDARMRANAAVSDVIRKPTPEDVASSGTSQLWRPELPRLCDGSPRAGVAIK